jgi:aconitate hydratase
MANLDSLKTKKTLTVNGIDYCYYSLQDSQKVGLGDASLLPFSLKILLENLLRHEDGKTVTQPDIQAVFNWLKDRRSIMKLRTALPAC